MTAVQESRAFPLRNSGIYRNLPGFDPSIRGLSALVCGATGISGFHAIRALLDTPNRWGKIYALSRKPIAESQLALLEPSQRERIKHLPIDLMASPAQISLTLKEAGVQPDYIFFFAYVQPKSQSGLAKEIAQELAEANVPMFKNFLEALNVGNLLPKRILLQTGGKYYGAHIGRIRTPMTESDPRPTHLGDNFYYGQEDALAEFCKAHPQVGWNVVRPSAIIGACSVAAINNFLPFAIYAAVQARKGEALEFGGSFDAWLTETCWSSARLTGFICEWAVLNESCKNQAFNAQDGLLVAWNRLFPEITRWFGASAGFRGPELDESKFKETWSFQAGKDTPLGFGPPMGIKTSFTIFDWLQKPENKDTWRSIMEESQGKITYDPFDRESPEMLGTEMLFLRSGMLDSKKLCQFGFVGCVDTIESIHEMYHELGKVGVLPPLVVKPE